MSSELLAVGRVARAHGIRGEVAVQKLTEVEDRFSPGASLSLEDGRTLTIEKARPHQHQLLVKFEEIPDRSGAESLRGELLLISPEASPPPPEGGFWVHQVVGLEVITEDGRSLGRISEIHGNPANDLWITESGALIPAVREVVVGVDIEAGKVTIRELPGLLDE